MNNNPLLSIIVPAYNAEFYIQNTVTALLNNTYKNFEILICDDCSNDNTWNILQLFKNNPQIKLFQNEKNRGPGYTRNKLLDVAKGEYIAIQDADDGFVIDRFSTQLDYLLQNQMVDVVGSGAMLISSGGDTWGEIKVREKPTCLQWILQKSVVHATIMFRRKVYEHHRYSEELRTGEDYFFLTQIYLNNFTIMNITKPLYYYTIDKINLKKRSVTRFNDLLKSKIIISKLFPLELRWIFILFNISLLLISSLRSLALICAEKIGRSNRK